MNKGELASKAAASAGVSARVAQQVLDASLAEIQRTVSNGERVALAGFGIFERVDRSARLGRNPKTREVIEVAPTRLPRFRPANDFKKSVSDSANDDVAEAPAAPVKRRATKATAAPEAVAPASKTSPRKPKPPRSS